MPDQWYLAERRRHIIDGIIKRADVSNIDPGLLEVWGQELSEVGEFSGIKLLDFARIEDGDKLRPKWWLKKILVEEIYYKEKNYFARRIVPALSLTMVFNEDINMWERLDLGPSDSKAGDTTWPMK